MYEETLVGSTVVLWLKYILHPDVMVDMVTSQYQYHLKDHLGNTRLVVNQNGKEIQQSAYYPFGLAFMQTINSDNKYLYNGKELQDDKLNGVKLDWYDYGARMYDAEIGRFFTMDPLAEIYIDNSPYNYTLNNPILFVDPDGMRVEWGDDVSKEDKRFLREQFRAWRKSSSDFKESWKNLKKSDYTYTISTKGGQGLASFKGNHITTIPGIEGTDEEPGTDSFDWSDGDPGGTLYFDMGALREADFDDATNAKLLEGGILEETMHTEQYDYYVHKYGQHYDDLPGYGDFESEVKAFNGIVKSNAGKPLSTGTDGIMEKYGVALQKGQATTSQYYSKAKEWYTHPKTHIKYKKMTLKFSRPEYLLLKAGKL